MSRLRPILSKLFPLVQIYIQGYKGEKFYKSPGLATENSTDKGVIMLTSINIFKRFLKRIEMTIWMPAEKVTNFITQV